MFPFVEIWKWNSELEPDRIAASGILHQSVPIIFEDEGSGLSQRETNCRANLEILRAIAIQIGHAMQRVICGLLGIGSADAHSHFLNDTLRGAKFGDEDVAAVITGR